MDLWDHCRLKAPEGVLSVQPERFAWSFTACIDMASNENLALSPISTSQHLGWDHKCREMLPFAKSAGSACDLAKRASRESKFCSKHLLFYRGLSCRVSSSRPTLCQTLYCSMHSISLKPANYHSVHSRTKLAPLLRRKLSTETAPALPLRCLA